MVSSQKKVSTDQILIKDHDWLVIANQPCKVIDCNFRDGKAGHARITLENVKIAANIEAVIFHKLDMQHLRAAFALQSAYSGTMVVIEWSKSHLTGFRKLLAPFMPRLSIMVIEKEAFELLVNQELRPELAGEARFLAERPVAMWDPLTKNATFLNL